MHGYTHPRFLGIHYPSMHRHAQSQLHSARHWIETAFNHATATPGTKPAAGDTFTHT